MQRIDILLKPSRLFFIFLMIQFGVGIGISISLTVPFVFKIGLFFFLISYTVYILWAHVLLLAPHALLRIKIDENGNGLFFTRYGVYAGWILGESTLTSFLIVLHVRVNGEKKKKKKVSYVIFRDAVSDSDLYRRWVVHMRCGQSLAKKNSILL